MFTLYWTNSAELGQHVYKILGPKDYKQPGDALEYNCPAAIKGLTNLTATCMHVNCLQNPRA